MKLYAEYIKEREEMDLFYTDEGFISYLCADNYIYIADLFIAKEHRRNKIGQKFLDMIIDLAKSQEKDYILAQVDTSTHGFNASIDGLLKNGFEFFSSENDIMHFKRVI